MRAPRVYDPQRVCPSCHIRYRIEAPAARDLYGPLYIDRKAYRWLENAARLFIKESGDESWDAADFIAWIRPDIYGERPPIVEHDGPARRKDGVRHPFPLPTSDWRPARREGTG